MVTRYGVQHNTKTLKAEMRRAGLSQSRAALSLGCTREHLNYVLNGRRTSESLLRRLRALIQHQPAA